ncbi:MAG: bifunctional 2-polyprenyl-6-hydroxyphenol methylase/3-demethylubiquinol 3-O-methyltransferase UbiG [Caulobacteraceae bacterium]
MSDPSLTSSSVDPAEVARFSAMAAQWWDSRGKFAPLHRFNPVRLAFIRQQALTRFARAGAVRAPFQGLRLLDIGCGGGLLCEPMARLGFTVTGIDASARNIAVAAAHAAEAGLAIDYRAATVEAMLAKGEERFDLILNMEVVEHVADPGAFLRDGARLLAPGGLMIVATLNRTLEAFALAKVGAEYLLRWLPAGTHDWRKFIKPEEIRRALVNEGHEIEGPFGVAFNPLSGRWSRSAGARINYLMTIGRPSV